jgi:hypothetical protein
MAMRGSETDQIRERVGSLGDPVLSDPDLADRLPLLFVDLLTPPTYRDATS